MVGREGKEPYPQGAENEGRKSAQSKNQQPFLTSSFVAKFRSISQPIQESEKQMAKNKNEAAYHKWLEEVRAKERKTRESEEEKKRVEAEKEAKKKAEIRQRQENLRKELEEKRAKSGLGDFKNRVSFGTTSSGRLIPYYDRSANPKPDYVNPRSWVD